MCVSNAITHALAAPVALAMLAGCSGGSQMPPAPLVNPALRQSILRSAAPGSLYVAQQGDTATYEFVLPNKQNEPPNCSDPLPNYGATGIGVNAQHVLYIPLLTAQTILTFQPNCGAAGPTLNDPNGEPVDVAFDNANNIVYVDDYSANRVDVYENGATSPTRTLSNPAVYATEGIAVDRHGSVFQSSLTPNIVEFPKGLQKNSKVLGLTGLSFPIGLEFDRKGNLIVIDEVNGILVYAPPLRGAPKKIIIPQDGSAYGKLDAANRNLYVSDLGHHAVDVYAYPSLKYKYTISNGLGRLVTGVAVDPPAPN
jgi:hypothetical protein